MDDSPYALSDALLVAASEGNVSEIDRLISRGGDPNIKHLLSGETCLHCSVGQGHLDATRRLLERGADPSIVTTNTSTSPLGVAALAGKAAMVELLLAFGARLSEREVATRLLPECRELGFNDIADMIESSY